MLGTTTTIFYNQLLYLILNNYKYTMFEQDNDRPHIAIVTTRFLHDSQITVLPWPASSPDFSSIGDDRSTSWLNHGFSSPKTRSCLRLNSSVGHWSCYLSKSSPYSGNELGDSLKTLIIWFTIFVFNKKLWKNFDFSIAFLMSHGIKNY